MKLPEIAALKDKCYELENKVNDLEQYSRKNSIRIYGMSELPAENTKEMVMNYLKNELSKEDIYNHDITRAHRLGRPSERDDDRQRPRSIIVQFSRYETKQEVIRAARRILKNCRQEKIPLPRIAVYEDLTAHNASVLKSAIELTRNKKLQAAWSYEGNIYVRSNQGKRYRVLRPEDLTRFTSENHEMANQEAEVMKNSQAQSTKPLPMIQCSPSNVIQSACKTPPNIPPKPAYCLSGESVRSSSISKSTPEIPPKPFVKRFTRSSLPGLTSEDADE